MAQIDSCSKNFYRDGPKNGEEENSKSIVSSSIEKHTLCIGESIPSKGRHAI
jgi:hypothetical protein